MVVGSQQYCFQLFHLDFHDPGSPSYISLFRPWVAVLAEVTLRSAVEISYKSRLDHSLLVFSYSEWFWR